MLEIRCVCKFNTPSISPVDRLQTHTIASRPPVKRRSEQSPRPKHIAVTAPCEDSSSRHQRRTPCRVTLYNVTAESAPPVARMVAPSYSAAAIVRTSPSGSSISPSRSPSFANIYTLPYHSQFPPLQLPHSPQTADSPPPTLSPSPRKRSNQSTVYSRHHEYLHHSLQATTHHTLVVPSNKHRT